MYTDISVIHKMVTGMNAVQNTDPSYWMSFLRSINNVAISNKIAKSKTVPHNLEQCMTRLYKLKPNISLPKVLI